MYDDSESRPSAACPGVDVYLTAGRVAWLSSREQGRAYKWYGAGSSVCADIDRTFDNDRGPISLTHFSNRYLYSRFHPPSKFIDSTIQTLADTPYRLRIHSQPDLKNHSFVSLVCIAIVASPHSMHTRTRTRTKIDLKKKRPGLPPESHTLSLGR